MLRIPRTLVLAALVAAAAAAGACATRSPSIADLQYNPGRYYDKTVRVEGIVSSSWGVPLVPFKVYQVEDATGEITVLSQTSRVPPRGARVEVTGRVEELATFGGRSLGMHIKERRLRVLGRS